MPLADYNGYGLVPGWGTAYYSVELDNIGFIYGSPHLCLFLTHALIDGASRDAGNTGNTTVLRPGLIMAQDSTTKKWRPFDASENDGTEQPQGVLTILGLNTQMNGADTDRFLATIMVGGNLNPQGLCIASTAAYGLDKVTAAHVTVRKAFKYSFRFSDDFMAYTAEALSAR